MPRFEGLTAAIVTESGFPLDDKQLKTLQLDQFLGTLKDAHQVDVHARVAEKIGNPASRPNKLHEAIVALALAGPTPRIVTTNYDTHLSTAVEARGRRLPEYLAPALPMGDDSTATSTLSATTAPPSCSPPTSTSARSPAASATAVGVRRPSGSMPVGCRPPTSEPPPSSAPECQSGPPPSVSDQLR